MRVSFTGTRAGWTSHQEELLSEWLRSTKPSLVAHGCCVGADIQFHQLVRKLFGRKVYVAVYPSTNKTRAPIPEDADFVAEPRPPLARNKTIISVGCDHLVATPKEMHEVLRSGTWHAIRRARRIGVSTTIFWPHE